MPSAAPPVPSTRGRLPVQGRDRRAALSALALLLVVAGALGAALVVYRTGHRTDVLVATQEIKAGQRITAADLGTARVASDSVAVIKASTEGSVLGTFARDDIPAGTLLNPTMFQVGSVLPDNGVVVGVPLSRSQRPASTISSGDVVRVYTVSKSSGGTATGTVLISAARVVDVSGDATSADTISISLLVTQDDSAGLISAVAQGSVSIGVLPKTAKPVIDYQSRS